MSCDSLPINNIIDFRSKWGKSIIDLDKGLELNELLTRSIALTSNEELTIHLPYFLKAKEYWIVKILIGRGVKLNLSLLKGGEDARDNYLHDVIYRPPEANELLVIWYLFSNIIEWGSSVEFSDNPNIDLQFVFQTLGKINWDWYYLSRNPAITLNEIKEHLHDKRCKWNVGPLVRRPDMTLAFVKEWVAPFFRNKFEELVRWFGVGATFKFTPEEALQYLDTIHPFDLARNKGMTLRFFTDHLESKLIINETKPHELYDILNVLSSAPYLTIDIYTKHLRLPIRRKIDIIIILDVPSNVASNEALPIEYILKSEELSNQKLAIAGRKDFTIDHLLRILESESKNSTFVSMLMRNASKHIPFSDIEDNMDLEWDFGILSGRNDLDLGFLLRHLKREWNMQLLSPNPAVTLRFINDHPEMKWVGAIFKNPNLTVGFALLNMIGDIGLSTENKSAKDPVVMERKKRYALSLSSQREFEPYFSVEILPMISRFLQ